MNYTTCTATNYNDSTATNAGCCRSDNWIVITQNTSRRSSATVYEDNFRSRRKRKEFRLVLARHNRQERKDALSLAVEKFIEYLKQFQDIQLNNKAVSRCNPKETLQFNSKPFIKVIPHLKMIPKITRREKFKRLRKERNYYAGNN